MKKFDTIYSQDIKGAKRFWFIEQQDENYRAVYGIVGGKENRGKWTEAVPKNVGKSNATSAVQQAEAEIKALYTDKLSKSYKTTIEDTANSTFFKPMLAKKMENYPVETVSVQPKLDGHRCIAKADGLFSRQGKKYNMPHISKALEQVFEKYPNIVLDGELYNHKFRNDFTRLSSIIREEKKTYYDYSRAEDIEFHIYDMKMPKDENFVSRIIKLNKYVMPLIKSNFVVAVETIFAKGKQCIDEAYEKFMVEGYEGVMVRLDGKYEEGKRSKNLLKYKSFEDKEFKLIKVVEGVGNWKGYAKSAVIELENGKTQSSGIMGDKEFTSKLLSSWNKFKYVTVVYQSRTPDGFLRFPVIKTWHENMLV